jgi:hypothetical protein
MLGLHVAAQGAIIGEDLAADVADVVLAVVHSAPVLAPTVH